MRRRALLVVPVLVLAAAGCGPLLLGSTGVLVLAGSGGAGPVPAGIAAMAGIPAPLAAAYAAAAAAAGEIAPGCRGVRWPILAGIGQVESGQAAGRSVAADGMVSPPVVGPRLDGSGIGGNRTPIRDTDGGQWDGDTVYDRAVGVLQFLPSSWRIFGRDADGDGVSNPHDVDDNAAAAVAHLCGSQVRDLAVEDELRAALFGYNRSAAYVQDVMGWIATYDAIALSASSPGVLPPGSGGPIADTAVSAAMGWLGTPYSWGGGGLTGPSEGFGRGRGVVGFDCSGLTRYAYAQAGITLPRVSADQFRVGTRLPREAGIAALMPGDLVFFAFNPVTGTGVHHVGIYVGGGQMVNAPRTGTTVRVEPLWLDSYAGGVRLTAGESP